MITLDTTELDIVLWDDPRLQQVCEPFSGTEFGPKLEAFAQNMIAIMLKKNGYAQREGQVGVGLAGSQVGLMKRIFVMNWPNELDKGHFEHPPIALCNPKLKLSGTETREIEGCLSFPSFSEQVARARFAEIEFMTPLGELRFLSLHDDKKGWIGARVAQHEEDHLNGIMFFNRVSKTMRKHLLKQWEKKVK